MDEKIKFKFKSLLCIFLKKAVQEIITTKKLFKKNFSNNVNKFSISDNPSWSVSYGDAETEVIDIDIVLYLYKYKDHFKFKEATELTKFITKYNLFNPLTNTEKRNFEGYLLRILEEYLLIRKSYTFTKKSINRYVSDLIIWLESEYLICEIALFLPNLNIKFWTKSKVDLWDWFYLSYPIDSLKENIVNSFVNSTATITNEDVNYKSVVEAKSYIYKKFKIKKDGLSYMRELGGYPNWNISKEIHKWIECVKKISIYSWFHVYISNAFYKVGDTESYLTINERKADRYIDFFVPHFVRSYEYSFKKGIAHFKRFYNKTLNFKFDNFRILFLRYLSAIKQEKGEREKVNSSIDYVIMLESLLDTNIEVSFQFALIYSHFFGKTKGEKEKLFKFFKAIYGLRSDLVHWNDWELVKGTINKLIKIDIKRYEKLKNYAHTIVLFLINNKINNRSELINSVKKELSIPTK